MLAVAHGERMAAVAAQTAGPAVRAARRSRPRAAQYRLLTGSAILLRPLPIVQELFHRDVIPGGGGAAANGRARRASRQPVFVSATFAIDVRLDLGRLGRSETQEGARLTYRACVLLHSARRLATTTREFAATRAGSLAVQKGPQFGTAEASSG